MSDTEDAAELFSAASEAPQPSGTPASTNLSEKARELTDALAEIELVEEALKVLKQVAHNLATVVLPEAMDAAGTSDTVISGTSTRLRLEQIVAGSLPKDEDRRARAINAIRAADGEHLIKNEVSVFFRTSQDNEAKELLARLVEEGFLATLQSDIHAQTLAAFGRECLADPNFKGDVSEFGLFVGRKVKVSEVKPKAPRKAKKA